MQKLLLPVIPGKANHIAKVTLLKNIVFLFVQVKVRHFFCIPFNPEGRGLKGQ